MPPYSDSFNFVMCHQVRPTMSYTLLVYWDEPERAPHLSNSVPRYLCIYVRTIHHSINSALAFYFIGQLRFCNASFNSVSASRSNNLDCFNFARAMDVCTYNVCMHVVLMTTTRRRLVIIPWVSQLQLPWAKWHVSKKVLYSARFC